MRGEPQIVTAAIVDARGTVGSGVRARTWNELGIDPLARACAWPRSLSPTCEKFRRMDMLSRSVLLAAEMTGIGEPGFLHSELRADTALVLATTLGCLESDMRFARGLGRDGEIEPAVFSYTLSSTCLGELAIRHGLMGPSFAFSTPLGAEVDGLQEARALLESNEASAAMVCIGDAIPSDPACKLGMDPYWMVGAFLVMCDANRNPCLAWDDVERAGFLGRFANGLWSRGALP